MLPGVLPSGWPKRSRSTSALLLEEQSPWLPQRRGACYMLAESQKPPGLLSIGADEGARIHILSGRACKTYVKLI